MRDETIVTVIHKVEDTGVQRRKKDACIVVIYGAELGRKYNIEGREMTIGRATANDICVSQDSVSRTHATIVVDENGVKAKGLRGRKMRAALSRFYFADRVPPVTDEEIAEAHAHEAHPELPAHDAATAAEGVRELEHGHQDR